MTAKLHGTEFGDGKWRTWNWEEEPSMLPFTKREVSDPGEYGGRMAELTSPGPGPSGGGVLLGQQGLTDVVTVFDNLRHLGMQVSLWGQLHVHVNALSAKAGGDCCMTTDQIANLWVSWARFQPVLDEMQPSTNVNNKWAMPLYLEDPVVRQVFENMHEVYGSGLDAKEACEAFYGIGMCDGKHAGGLRVVDGYRPPTLPADSVAYVHSPARYYALNLAPLTGKGTIEVRQNAGTNDPERAQRWIQFVLAFVETFKDSGAGFFAHSLQQDIANLQEAQEQASFKSLFAALGKRVSDDTQAYFEETRWAKKAPEYTDRKEHCSL